MNKMKSQERKKKRILIFIKFSFFSNVTYVKNVIIKNYILAYIINEKEDHSVSEYVYNLFATKQYQMKFGKEII